MINENEQQVVVLLSGGVDSAAILGHIIRRKKINPYTVHCMYFDYGQRHEKEGISASRVAEYYKTNFYTQPLKVLGKITADISALTGLKVDVPDVHCEGVAPTYVPFRNTVFISVACSFLETLGGGDIYYGANCIDFSNYPDCRPDYVTAMQSLVRVASQGKISLYAPLLYLSKRDIVKLGVELNVPFDLTWSCYLGGDEPCKTCPSCRFRIKAFEELGLTDPLLGKEVIHKKD